MNKVCGIESKLRDASYRLDEAVKSLQMVLAAHKLSWQELFDECRAKRCGGNGSPPLNHFGGG